MYPYSPIDSNGRLFVHYRVIGVPVVVVSMSMLGNGLAVSTLTVVAGSIPAFSTCLFHVVPRVPGGAVDEKTGPVVLYGRIKPVLIVSIYLMGPSAIIG